MPSYQDKIGLVGSITSGNNAGYSVRIENDAKQTGGFLILGWSQDRLNAFDYWVEKMADLEGFFDESGWEVEWPSH